MSQRMPNVDVKFLSAVDAGITRAERGYVGIIIHDHTGEEEATSGSFQVRRTLDIPADISTENVLYIERALVGSNNSPARIYVYWDNTEEYLENGLDFFAARPVSYLCGPRDCTQEQAKTIASWVADQNDNQHGHYVAVLPNYAGGRIDVINWCGTGMTDGETIYTTAEYCTRIAGAAAGCKDTATITYLKLAELTDCGRLDIDEQNAAVAAGKLICWYDGKCVRLGTEVNSKVELDSDENEEWQSIHAVSMMMMIDADLRETANTSFIGKRLNSYDNQCLLLAAVQGYLKAQEAAGLISVNTQAYLDVDAKRTYLAAPTVPGETGIITDDMTDMEVLEWGKHVFISADFTIYLGMEQFHFTFRV